jgi:predicted amidohydrolase
METISVGLWATNLEIPAVSLSAWLDFIEARMAELQQAGFRLLMLPEFACAQWLSFAPSSLSMTQQVPWLAGIAREACARLRPLSARYNVALLPGTMPFALSSGASDPQYVNRAWLFLPDGRLFGQDKLRLTPSEQNPEAWHLLSGSTVSILEWEGLRVAIVICLDIEFTSLWARLGKLDLDLILVPAKTDKLSGYNRVFGCAAARAIELQTVVCAVGAVGSPLGHPAFDTVMGGASVYVPCDAAVEPSGIVASLGAHMADSGLSPILYARDLPVGQCRRIRHGAAEAEVWPSSWPADHVTILDPAKSLPENFRDR